MAGPINKQIGLKPQDLVVALKIALSKELVFTYAALSGELGMSPSQVHAAVQRSQIARLLVTSHSEGILPIRAALREFVVHGAKYAFPPVMGSITRGMPTAYAGPILRLSITQPDEAPPVWPHPNGNVRGIALYPLYPGAPAAAEKDSKLYEMLTLIDALRIGAARERGIAENLIEERLA